MKVLYVTQGYTPAIGGTEILIQRVSEELVHTFGDDVTVFTTNCYSGDAFYTPSSHRMSTGWEEINGVKVRRFAVCSWLSRLFYPFRPSNRKFFLPGNQYLRTLYNGPIIPGLARAIKNSRFDIIVASSFPLLHMFTSLGVAQKMGRPCILMGGLHPEDKWGFDRPMIYKAIQKTDHYIAYTEYEAEYVINRGAKNEKVSVIGVGVDQDQFESIDPIEAKLRIDVQSAPLIGYIGQISGHKGVGVLLEAMPLVWQEVPQARLLIAGAKTQYSRHLEQIIDQFPDSDKNKIILRTNFSNDEKPWLFSATDVIAYPSGFESFGIVFLEAWAAMKPVIGCRRGAVPWVIDAGRDGLLVDYQNKYMLAEAIILLIKNRRWANSLGQAGNQKVKAQYTWHEISKRFRKVYENVINSNQCSLK